MASGLWVGPTSAAPYIPHDDTQVLERVRAPGGAQARQLRQLRGLLAKDPDDLGLALRLATLYAEMGRAEGDPRYFGYVQATLGRWWGQAKPPPEVLVLRAFVRQGLHDFDGALQDLDVVLEAQPRNAQAWLTRAVILQVLGEYAGALRSCLPLSRLSNALVATTCISSAASLGGQAETSYHALRMALQDSPSANPQLRLWALTVLADIATRLGREEAAERHFREALSLGLRDTYLLGAYADFLLDRNRPKEVRALLKDDTGPDGLLLRLALAEQMLNAPQLKNYIEGLRARFAASRLRNLQGDTPHLRTEARFTLHLLKKPAEALRLAQENWALQREPWDARLLLEAALEAGEPAAARGVLDWLAISKLEDIWLRPLVERLEAMQQ